MKRALAFCVLLIIGSHSVFGQEPEDIIIGKSFKIYSEILNEERTCLISLPDSYDEAAVNQKYPVMILLDGYTHFKTAAGITHFMSSARNRNNMIPEMIIVAIENVDRERDFTITKIKTVRPSTMGGGHRFLDFMEQELIPSIDSHYPTDSFKMLTGHSLGGLLTVNAYKDEQSAFDAFLAIDPSIWWDESLMIAKVDSISPVSFDKRLYIATANQGERNYERNKKKHDTLFEMMKQRSKGSFQTKLQYFDNEDHRSVSLIAIYEGLKFIFKETQEE
ncbi:MAG TPA: alpha/beta hydrolase-fold protein [Roseivirga sp.]